MCLPGRRHDSKTEGRTRGLPPRLSQVVIVILTLFGRLDPNHDGKAVGSPAPWRNGAGRALSARGPATCSPSYRGRGHAWILLSMLMVVLTNRKRDPTGATPALSPRRFRPRHPVATSQGDSKGFKQPGRPQPSGPNQPKQFSSRCESAHRTPDPLGPPSHQRKDKQGVCSRNSARNVDWRLHWILEHDPGLRSPIFGYQR